jgi:hypothetical protein
MAAAVEKPGTKISCNSGAFRRDEAAFDGLLADFLNSNAGTVIGDLDDDVAALLCGPQLEDSLGILAGGQAHIGHLDAVIKRVSYRMSQRILDGFEETLVQLRVLALDLQPHAAAKRLR